MVVWEGSGGVGIYCCYKDVVVVWAGSGVVGNSWLCGQVVVMWRISSNARLEEVVVWGHGEVAVGSYCNAWCDNVVCRVRIKLGNKTHTVKYFKT